MPARNGYTYVMPDTEEISVDEAAEILDVSRRHVRWYRENGYLVGRKTSGVWLFKRIDVEWLKANKPKRSGRPKSKRNEDPPCDTPQPPP